MSRGSDAMTSVPSAGGGSSGVPVASVGAEGGVSRPDAASDGGVASSGSLQMDAAADATMSRGSAASGRTDAGFVDAAVTAAGIAVDAVLSVDTIRIYKPQPAVYAMVTERFGVAPADIAFISSNRWDVMGATAFGFRCVWVNRANLPDEYAEFRPVAVVRDLASLATLSLA